MQIDQRILIIGVLFFVKFLFGFWLYRTGKPYNSLILTIHKLVSLAALVYVIIIANSVRLIVGLAPFEILIVSITIALFLVSIATGGVLSTDKPDISAVSALHKVAPILSVLATAETLYLLVW